MLIYINKSRRGGATFYVHPVERRLCISAWRFWCFRSRRVQCSNMKSWRSVHTSMHLGSLLPAYVLSTDVSTFRDKRILEYCNICDTKESGHVSAPLQKLALCACVQLVKSHPPAVLCAINVAENCLCQFCYRLQSLRRYITYEFLPVFDTTAPWGPSNEIVQNTGWRALRSTVCP